MCPWGVTVAPDGYVWVADTGRKRLVRMARQVPSAMR